MSEKYVHAVKLDDGAYIVSPEFAKEIEKHTIKDSTQIAEVLGMKVIVSDTLPFLEDEPEPCDYCKAKGREYTPECEENK